MPLPCTDTTGGSLTRTLHSPEQSFPFLAGGGALGALMRQHDWTRSPLGPPSTWPHALRSVVGLLLNSKFPMFVAWGPRLGFLYNDAYAEILGKKHPAALGAPFHDIWAEIWSDIEPLVAAAMRGEAIFRENLPLIVNRRGGDEQAWFTFSYSPVREDDGHVAGMFCAVSETTAQMLSQRAQAFRLALEQKLHGLGDAREVMRAACEALGRELGVARAGYCELDAAQPHLVVEGDWTDGTVASVEGRHRLDDVGRPVTRELLEGKTLAVEDVRTDSRVAPSAGAFARMQTRAMMTVPLRDGDRMTALLYLHHSTPRRWTEQELRLAEEAAGRTRAAVERARAEAERRRSEASFRALATAGAYSLYRMSPDWSQLRQLDGQGFLADTVQPTEGWLQQYLHPDDQARVLAAVAEAVRTRGVFDLELRVKLADGRWGWARSRAVPVFNEDGTIREWLGAASDVTARRQAEEQVREAHEQFQALVENLPALAWSAGPDGGIEYFNRRWYEYTGTTLDEMRGWGWERLHAPALLPGVTVHWRESLMRGEPFEMEFPLRGADGTYRWFLTRVQPLRNARGELVRWFGSNTNVDEHRRQAAALKEAVEVRDNFLSIASHELRTPLTPMSLRLQVLERKLAQTPDGPLRPDVEAYVAGARKQLRVLTSLVNDLLDVSRISSGRLTLELEPTDLAALVTEVVTRYEPEAQRLGSTLTIHAPERLELKTARARVDQVVTNLLDNAIKYGGGSAITVSLDREGNTVTLRVADGGIGIEPHQLSRIFERFERAVSERNYGGLGLGLYISRAIVESLGGRIRVRSKPGKGAEFTVELPVTP